MSRAVLPPTGPPPRPTPRGFDWDTPCARNDRQKDRFHKVARALLRRVSDELGLELGGYEIRSEKGTPDVSGRVTLRHERFQVEASQPAAGGDGLLIRTCEDTPDLTGVTCERVPLGLLDDPESLAERIRAIQPRLDRRRMPSPT